MGALWLRSCSAAEVMPDRAAWLTFVLLLGTAVIGGVRARALVNMHGIVATSQDYRGPQAHLRRARASTDQKAEKPARSHVEVEVERDKTLPLRARRYAAKAGVLRAAWRARFGAEPTPTALVNAMAVAELETEMGDAWPNENNWGAVMKRPLSTLEATALRRVRLRVDRREESLRAARALLAPGENEALHRDWLPGKVPYFAWFWAFETPLEGATKFLDVFVAKTRGIRAIIDRCSAQTLAVAMYDGGYFTGLIAGDRRGNINAYSESLRHQQTAIRGGLGHAAARR